MSDGDMFKIGLDTSGLDKDKLEVIKTFDSMAEEAMRSGKAIDEAISGSVSNISTSLSGVDASKLSERLGEHISRGTETLKELQDEISVVDEQLRSSFDSQEIERLAEKKVELREKAQTLTAQLGQLTEMQRQLANTTEQSAGSTENLSGSLKGAVEAINPMNEVIGRLPRPLQDVIRGLQGMTGAARTFIAIPLIAVITAIATAVMTLTSWFRSSAEGQKAFARVSGYVSGVLGQLKEVVIAVGKALYDAFTNPQEAVRKLWDSIKTNIVNRFEGLGEMFRAIGRIISSGFTEGYDELNNAFLKTTTGVDNLIGKTNQYIKGVTDAAKKTADLRVAERELQDERSQWLIKEAELDERISEARNKMYLGDDDERLKAALEVEELVNEKYAQRIKFAEEEYRIFKETSALTSSTQEDIDEERRLQAEITRLSAQRNSELRMTMRMKGSLERSASGRSSTEDNEALRLQQEYENTLLSLRQRVEQDRYNLTKESIEDRQRLLDAEYQYEMNLILKSKDDFIKKFGADADTSIFDELLDLSDDKRIQKTQKLFNDILDDYKTFEERRNAIIEKYANDRKILEDRNIDGQYDANIEELNKKEREALAQFDTQAQDKTSIMARMFSDMSNKSIEELKKIRDEAEELWKFLSEGDWDAERGKLFGITKEQFEEIIADPTKLGQFKKGLDDIKDAIIAIDSPLEKIKEGFKELFNTDNQDTKKQLEGLQKIQDGYSKYADAVGLVSDAISNLADLTDSGVLSRIADGLNDVLSVGNDAMQGAMVGTQIGGTAGAIAGAVVGVVKGVAGIFSRNKQAREELRKQIEENQRQEYFGQLEIEAIWRRKYDWSKRIGESTLHYLKREGDELKRQGKANEDLQAELFRKLRQEQYKSGEYFKKTGLFGWGKGKIVEEWSSLAGKTWEQIEALAYQGKLSEEGQKFYEALKKAKEEGASIEDMQEQYLEKMKEVYTGTTYESLVSGIVDAFKQGRRSATDFAKSFEELLKGAVASSIEMLADEDMREWYEKYADYAKDGLTAEEIDRLRKDYIQINENLEKQARELEAITGVSLSEQAQGDATYGMYERITQGQANSIDGRLTGLYSESTQQTAIMNSMDSRMEEVRNISLDSLSELILIRRHTALLNDTNSKLDKVISNTDRL